MFYRHLWVEIYLLLNQSTGKSHEHKPELNRTLLHEAHKHSDNLVYLQCRDKYLYNNKSHSDKCWPGCTTSSFNHFFFLFFFLQTLLHRPFCLHAYRTLAVHCVHFWGPCRSYTPNKQLQDTRGSHRSYTQVWFKAITFLPWDL